MASVARALLGSGQQSKRVPITRKDDKHMQHGQLLLSLQQAPSSLERLLAVAKLSVTFLSDLMRRSDDTQDIPLLVLGHHYLSHRVLGDPTAGTAAVPRAAAAAAAALAAAAPPAAAAAPAAGAAAAASAEGGTWRVYVQEVCTFDAQEGPKGHVDMQGVPQAILALSLEPTAITKAKRLGRDLSIKVTLQPPAAGSSSSSSSSVVLVGCGEEFFISWPSLLLLDPIGPACSLAFKGDLEMSCPQSGLFLTLTFAKDHTVKGTIEQLKPAKPPAYAAAGAAAGGASVPAPAAAAGISTSSGRVGGGAGRGQVVGSLEGSWMGVINVVCPSLGSEGVLYDVKALNPMPVPSVDLRHMGPMRLSRFWSAVHDTLLYADPRAASGGRAAAKLASTLGHYLSALTLDSAAARDVAAGLGGGSSAGASSSIAGGSKAAAPSSIVRAGTDPSLEEFDRQVEGLSSGKQGPTQDTRDVPPCYKEQHAAGNQLRYQLHYTLTCT